MAAALDLPVLFEDEDILAVNKPFGVVVNRSDSYTGETVQDWMADRLVLDDATGSWDQLIPENFDQQYGEPAVIFQERLGMVHRLDKDTSGVLLLSKNPGSLVNLLRQFRDRETEKEYLCLTHGKFVMEEGKVNLPIGRRKDDRKLFGVVADGRPAETEYSVLKYYPDFQSDLLPEELRNQRFSLYQGFSLVECRPKTGRTHQIRVHMQHLKHPIVGDNQYVGKKRARLDSFWAPRQFLHASSLKFSHPRTGEKITISAPLHNDLKQVLRFVGEESYNV